MSKFTLGPIRIRTSWKGVAKWGYPPIEIGGLALFVRDSGGRLQLAGYHPRKSTTWHWFVALYRAPGKPGYFNLEWRPGYGERGLHLFGWTLSITRQGYHKESPKVGALEAPGTAATPGLIGTKPSQGKEG